MPRSQIQRLNLKRGLMVNAVLGDGRKSRMDTFVAWIDWVCELREVEVIASEDRSTLLGVGLMLSHHLVVDYRTLRVRLEFLLREVRRSGVALGAADRQIYSLPSVWSSLVREVLKSRADRNNSSN